MQITVRRSGGLAGVDEEVAAVDTARLDPAARQRVENQVRAADLFALPRNLSEDVVGADMLRYEITIADGPRSHTVSYVDEGGPAPEAVRGVLEVVKNVNP